MGLTSYRPKLRQTNWGRYDRCGCGAEPTEACFDMKQARYRFAAMPTHRHLAPRKTSIPHKGRPRLPEWQGRRNEPRTKERV